MSWDVWRHVMFFSSIFLHANNMGRGSDNIIFLFLLDLVNLILWYYRTEIMFVKQAANILNFALVHGISIALWF